MNKNNPVLYEDPKGDCPTCYDEDGKFIGDVDDEAVANGIVADFLSTKHSIYNLVLSFVGSDKRATFVENEDGNYETGFVETQLTPTQDLVNFGLDLLTVSTFGKSGGGGTTGLLLIKVPAKTVVLNGLKQANKVNGNSKLSNKVQHGYEIVNKKSGKIVDQGISGRKLTSNEVSPRATEKIRTKFKNDPDLTSRVTKKNIGPSDTKTARQRALNYEQGRANSFSKSPKNRNKGQGPPQQKLPKPTM